MQARNLGGPFIMHPLATAALALELGLDTHAVCAALLHDVVEDTRVTLDEIALGFGSDVAQLVDGVTKLGHVGYSSREEEQAENLRKTIFATARDVRVMFIKLCDRLHNMRTARGWQEQTRRDKALETMEVYAPIARRLGMAGMQRELEALSLQCLDPIGYAEMIRQIRLAHGSARCMEGVLGRLRFWLRQKELPYADIHRRGKSAYSLYRRSFAQTRHTNTLFCPDFLCILVDTVPECYAAQEAVCKLYPPLPGGSKDYIARPKSNLYQSLHSTHLGPEGIIFQVQIRTRRMDETAEYGVAACWKYGKDEQRKNLAGRLAWVNALLEGQRGAEDGGDLRHDIKKELVPNEITVYTPKKDDILLPEGATVIDFAYAIHSHVGNSMVGARVNGHSVPINHRLCQDEVVEVLTDPNSTGPARAWLNDVSTGKARSSIRQWLKKNRREENIILGKAMLHRALKEAMIAIPPEQYESFMAGIARQSRMGSDTELYAALGYGGLHLSRLLPRVQAEYKKRYDRTDAPL